MGEYALPHELVGEQLLIFSRIALRSRLTTQQNAWAKLRDGAAIATRSCGVEFESVCAG